MSKYRYAGLLAHNIGDVVTAQIGKHVVRRETALVDDAKFYRFTVNPGFSTEFGTFWSEDETYLLRIVYRRAGVPFA